MLEEERGRVGILWEIVDTWKSSGVFVVRWTKMEEQGQGARCRKQNGVEVVRGGGILHARCVVGRNQQTIKSEVTFQRKLF